MHYMHMAMSPKIKVRSSLQPLKCSPSAWVILYCNSSQVLPVWAMRGRNGTCPVSSQLFLFEVKRAKISSISVIEISRYYVFISSTRWDQAFQTKLILYNILFYFAISRGYSLPKTPSTIYYLLGS